MPYALSLIENLANMLFPKLCVGCGAMGSYICLRCEKKLILLEKQLCTYCNRPSLFGLTHPGCRKGHGVDGVISGYRYSPLLKRVIKTAKYRLAVDALHDILRIAIPVLAISLSTVRSPYRSLVLVPIPLYWKRKNKRGFNQSEIICAEIARFLPAYSVQRVLQRTKSSRDQARIHGRQIRVRNISGVFQVSTRVNGMRILLVDDVITTGATIKEAAKVLKEAGARYVYGLSLARG